MKKNERLNTRSLIISIVLALAVWTFIFERLSLALILVFSILIHEFGHYFWMGREGIKKRSMIMVPPLGAIAFSGEIWPSYEAEARIALAGPLFGLIPALIFLILALVTNEPIWAASVVLAAFINLFNLVPAAPLDGGRCFRAVIVSLNPSLRFISHIIVFVVLLTLWYQGFFLAAIFITFMWWREERSFTMANRILLHDKPTLLSGLSAYQCLRNHYPENDTSNVPMTEYLNDLKIIIEETEQKIKQAEQIVSIPRMNKKDIVIAGVGLAALPMLYAGLWLWASSILGHKFFIGSLEIFKYF